MAVVTLALPALAGRPAGAAPRPARFDLATDCDSVTRAWLVTRLDAYRRALDVLVPAVTGVAAPTTPVRLLVFERPERYAAYVSENAPALGHSGGYYDGSTRTVVSHLVANPLRLHFHEIAHAVMGDVFDDPRYERYGHPRWPVWLDEGFAEYVSSYDVEAGAFRFGVPNLAHIALLVDALDRGLPFSLDDLLEARVARFAGAGGEVLYALSWAFVDLLLAEPDLRDLLPAWIARLRAGADGRASFDLIFGAGLGPLQARLAGRVRALAAEAARGFELAPSSTLDAWTVHDRGRWRAEADTLSGQMDRSSYITRAVPPMRRAVVTVEIRADATSFGVVLGSHGASLYPYHTVVDIGRERTTVRHPTATDRSTLVARRDVPGPPATTWLPARLEVADGTLTLRVGDRAPLVVPTGRPSLSLVGLHVRGGSADFRGLRVVAL